MQGCGENMNPEKMINQARKTKGYLLKKSHGLLGGWKSRYFLIINGAIMYYTDEALQKLKGEITFKSIQFIIMKGKNEFTLKTNNKEIDFRCHHEKDRDLWVASINLVKESMNVDGLSEKFLVKRNDPEKNCNPFQICSFREIQKVLFAMKLTLLGNQLEETRIHERIFCQKVGEEYLVSISIKSLYSPEVDEEILNEKYIYPFNFNKLYKIYANGAVEELSKMSQMQSLKTDQSSLLITFADKNQFILSYKTESEAYQISKKICRCYEVSKEYYNPFKIVLKKNIDRHVYLFDNFRVLFEEQLKFRVVEHAEKYLNCTSDGVETFLKEFKEIIKDLIETEEALRVLTPPRDDIKLVYFQITHHLILPALSTTWEHLFSLFCPQNLIRFSMEVYEYWIVVNQTVSDSILLLGCWDLNRFFTGRIGESIKEKIHSFNPQKVEFKKIKNEPIANELTLSFLEWIKEISPWLSETVPIEVVFNEYCSFFTKHFDEFLEYLTDISEKWNENLVIIGACNDLSRIKNYFQKHIGSELCKGIVSEKKFAATCGNAIFKKIDETIATLIRRVFLLVFITIDKKLLTKHFLEVDFGKICYEVLQRLEPFNNKVFEDVGLQILILSFDEICLFLYTVFMNKNIPQVKNIKDHYFRVLEKGLIEIEQYYCNIKTESQVKPYLTEISELKEVLICPEEQIATICSKLYHTFEASFTKENIWTILEIRQTNKQKLEYLLEEVCEIFSKPLSDDSENFTDSHSLNRNRFSVSESVYAISLNEKTEQNHIVKEGYLDFKAIVKGTANFYSTSYFRIFNAKLVEYYSQNEPERSIIKLAEIDHCYLNSKGQEFVIISNTKTYLFKAKTRDDAGLWVQAIYSEIRSPLFESKNLFAENGKSDTLFKNLEAELTTTSSHRWKIRDNTNDEKILELKRERNIEKVDEELKTDILLKKLPWLKEEIPPIKTQQKLKKKDEGTCCTSKIF